jgi:preprotein translocase subunit SecG
MSFLIGLLTFILIVDCLLLVLLVLVQLPKKDAGAGLAFGGAASDALFGAGSGNVLTKTTKYAAGVFFVLAIILSAMQSRHFNRSGAEFRQQLEQEGRRLPATTPETIPGAPGTATPVPGTPPASSIPPAGTEPTVPAPAPAPEN